MMSIYDFQLESINKQINSLSDFKNHVILIVNTATKCGFSKQLIGLEKLYQEYKVEGFVVIGFPCNQFANQEPGTIDKIKSVCQLNFGVTFPLMSKIEVNGKNEHPLYKYLKAKKRGALGKKIKWNFTKFLIDKKGEVVKRFSPLIKPCKIRKDIEKLLNIRKDK